MLSPFDIYLVMLFHHLLYGEAVMIIELREPFVHFGARSGGKIGSFYGPGSL